jgi:hypothetical protein
MTDLGAGGGRFHVVESFCDTPRPNPAANEDRLLIGKHFVAIIDGASSSGSWNGASGGALAADAARDALETLDPSADARAFADAANRRIAALIGSWADPRIARPSAAVVAYSAARGEIWRIGDCHVRVDGEERPGRKAVDELAYAYRAAVVRARLRLGLSDASREAGLTVLEQPFMALVAAQHAFQNGADDDPLGYGALDGTATPDRYVEVIPVAGAREIVLCSDGFLRPYATLSEAIDANRQLAFADPLMVRLHDGSRPFNTAKGLFDDVAYIRLRLGEL